MPDSSRGLSVAIPPERARKHNDAPRRGARYKPRNASLSNCASGGSFCLPPLILRGDLRHPSGVQSSFPIRTEGLRFAPTSGYYLAPVSGAQPALNAGRQLSPSMPLGAPANRARAAPQHPAGMPDSSRGLSAAIPPDNRALGSPPSSSAKRAQLTRRLLIELFVNPTNVRPLQTLEMV
jgi:hypothetical protein